MHPLLLLRVLVYKKWINISKVETRRDEEGNSIQFNETTTTTTTTTTTASIPVHIRLPTDRGNQQNQWFKSVELKLILIFNFLTLQEPRSY